MSGPPSLEVTRAFGVSEKAELLSGDQGTSWRTGDVVFKRTGLPLAELAWQAQTLGPLSQAGIRFPVPLRAAGGRLIVDGWSAFTYLAGQHTGRCWTDVIRAGERFHLLVRDLPRPAFLALRADRWSVADRVAWEELPIQPFLSDPVVRHLNAYVKPVHAPSQLIHGDLTGNVLFVEEQPAAVIDLSLYWRPPVFASAIVVADALVWEGADAQLVQAVADLPGFGQCLLRALIYRRVTDLLKPGEAPVHAVYVPACDLVCSFMTA